MQQQSQHPAKTHNLPLQSTPFIDRTNEVAEIVDLLTDPACRLLTLVGPGGIGKTRLVIEMVSTKGDDFTNGIYFVPLQPIHSSDFLVSAIADVVKFPLSGPRETHRRLCKKEIMDVIHFVLWNEPYDII
jgi:predicted ATPase